jgi:tRNA (Thr-GGU) A37 N-methylase
MIFSEKRFLDKYVHLAVVGKRIFDLGYRTSEHKITEKTPIQPVYAKECKGRVEICSEYEEEFRNIEGFSNIYLICYF